MLLNHILVSLRQPLLENRKTLNLSNVGFLTFPVKYLMLVATSEKDAGQLDRCWTDRFNNSFSLCLYAFYNFHIHLFKMIPKTVQGRRFEFFFFYAHLYISM